MSRLSARALVAAVAVAVVAVAAACGSLRRMTSEVGDAKVACAAGCEAGMAVAVGVPIRVEVDWNRCDSRDQQCDPDKPPFTIHATCEGSRCGTDDTGAGDIEITPVEPGTATIVVNLADAKQREVRLGPVTAMTVDGIDLVCTFRRLGGDAEAGREPCGDAVPPGSDVHVEIVARSGDRRLVNALPKDITIDGRFVMKDGAVVGDASWSCKASIDSSDPTVPTVRKCSKSSVPAGARWTLEASLPALGIKNRVAIKVAK
jgi:hypothetical protein